LASGRSTRSDPYFSLQEGDEASGLSGVIDFATSIKSGHEPAIVGIFTWRSCQLPAAKASDHPGRGAGLFNILASTLTIVISLLAVVYLVVQGVN
jgi:hypothetical protein